MSKDWLLLLPEWRADFAPNGTLVREGDIIRRPNLANTLETIAKEGADAFYTVSIDVNENISLNSYNIV